jgi:hypothetical protein
VPAHPVDVVDVLDVHRALLHARPAVGAGPDHIRVDDAAVLAHQRALGLFLHLVGELLAIVVAGGQEVRRLGEGVVAQVQDDLLGR